jgi:hypothetical protein
MLLRMTMMVGVVAGTAAIAHAGTQPASGSSTQQEGVIDPRADAALRRMSDYLGSLESFRVDTTSVDEKFSTEGQKIQELKQQQIAVRRPAQLLIDRVGPNGHAVFRTDGKCFSFYNSVYEDALFRKGLPTADLLATSDRDEKLVMVGDALMHPAELLDPGGSLYMSTQTRASGIEWLRRLAHHFRSAAWLNPEPDRFWAGTTIEVIASVLPMFPLTLDGLAQAVRYLVRGGQKPQVGDPSRWMKAMAR